MAPHRQDAPGQTEYVTPTAPHPRDSSLKAHLLAFDCPSIDAQPNGREDYDHASQCHDLQKEDVTQLLTPSCGGGALRRVGPGQRTGVGLVALGPGHRGSAVPVSPGGSRAEARNSKVGHWSWLWRRPRFGHRPQGLSIRPTLGSRFRTSGSGTQFERTD